MADSQGPRRATGEQQARVEQFLDQYGPEAVDLALRTGALYGDLREVSRFAIDTALRAYEVGMPATLLLQLRSGSAARGERVEVRAVLGKSVQLVLDFR